MRLRNAVMTMALVAGALVAGTQTPALAVVPDGVLYERSTRNTGGNSFGVAIGDVTSDGLDDLVVTHHEAPGDPTRDHAVLVFVQQAGGTLAGAPVIYDIGVAAPTSASLLVPALGDLDGDGDTDLVVGHEDGLDIFLQAAGAFGAPTTLAQANPVHEVEVADLNGDLRDDLVFSITDPTGFRYLRRLQKADGTMAGWVALGTGAAGSVAVGDVTGDDRPDVVVEDPTADAAKVFVHNADDQLFTETTDGRIAGVVAAEIDDVTGDAIPDLVYTTDAQLFLMEGQAAAAVADPVAVGAPFAAPVAIETGDLNEDAATDVVLLGGAGTRVVLQDDAGALGALTCDAPSVFPTPTGGNETASIGDLNDDGDLELVGAQEDTTVRRLNPRAPGAAIAASITTQPPASPIEHGQATSIDGWVLTPGGRCGEPGQAHLERTLPGGDPQIVSSVDLAPDTEDGTSATFHFSDVPTVVGDVTYRVLWDGDAFHDAAAGQQASVHVDKRSSTLTLDASDESIPAGSSTTLIATLTGGDRPAPVTFFKIVNGVRQEIGTSSVGGQDRATFDVSPAATSTYIATYEATPTAKGATSNKLTIEVAKRQSSLTLSAPSRIVFGKKATLSAKLTGGTGTRKVAFHLIRDGDRRLLGRVAVNDKGVATFAVKPTKNSKYVATFEGDGTWSSATSPIRTVKVRVVTTGRMVHFGHKQNGYAFYLCCRAYFAFEVAPNHAGDRVLVESQYLDGSVWRAFDGSSRHFRLRADSSNEIFTEISGGRNFKFRIRACMDTHADHDGDCSTWAKFRFE